MNSQRAAERGSNIGYLEQERNARYQPIGGTTLGNEGFQSSRSEGTLNLIDFVQTKASCNCNHRFANPAPLPSSEMKT
jgi:hypothetical protein